MKWQAKSSVTYGLPTSWQEIQNGSQYRILLEQYFASWFPKILGYHILNIGGLSGEIECELPLRNQMVICPQLTPPLQRHYAHKGDHTLINSKITELPFIDQHIDACLLINTLNFCQDPHKLLREVTRVLADDGYLFISLFSLCSPLLFKAYLNRKNEPLLPFRQFMTWQVADWLALLGFEILEQKPLVFPKLPRCCSPLTVMVAQKRTRAFPLTIEPPAFGPQPIFQKPQVCHSRGESGLLGRELKQAEK